MAITDPRQEIEHVCLLLERYFDLGSYEVDAVMTDWLQQFELTWIQSALVEALYQGRYKILSVDHILRLWGRRGQPLRHYNREFEAMISGQPVLFPSPLPAGESEPIRKSSGLGLPSTGWPPAESLPNSQPAALPPHDNPFLQPSVRWGDSLVQQPEAAPEEAAIANPWDSPTPETAPQAADPSSWEEASAATEADITSFEAGSEPLGIEPFKPLSSLHQKTGG
ncbi:MAG: hypothetical protein ICV62_14795, partial [Cyanobacteria bacterium Co-bin13]|nr:hypothetical protein [Cyanobacteria bacterium Co-bin13]